MKVIFMGTPEFAVPILREIHKEHEVVLVVTQPDSPVGRKRLLCPPPVKVVAEELGLEVYQPENIRKEDGYIKEFDADIIITAAYGQIIGKSLLEYFKYKSINIHGSLLPKYRGGAPIQWALINGEAVTGITIMYMAPKMDAGDILRQAKIVITDEDNQETLFSKMSNLGATMILPFLKDLEDNKITPIPQDESQVTFAYNITRDDELIDFEKDATSCFNLIRGLNPNPGAYTLLDGQVLKIYDSRVINQKNDFKPGKIVSINKDSFTVSCGGGSTLEILAVQLQGKKRLSSRDFINGLGRRMLEINKRLGGNYES